MSITEMSYQELVAKATEHGFKNANRTKKVELLNFLHQLKPKTETQGRGRPVNPNSERQKRLALMAEKKSQGVEIKRGRPVDPNSERQKRLAKVGTVKRGRPVMENSARQKRLAEMEKKRAAGIEIKRGRPKMIISE